MTKERKCFHCGTTLTHPKQLKFCSREHFREYSKKVAELNGRKCAHCEKPLTRFQKTYCSRKCHSDFAQSRNETPAFTTEKCLYCGGFIPKAIPGKQQNKLYCNGEHRLMHAKQKRTEKAAWSIPIPVYEPRWCEHEGCEKELERYQKRFCCKAHAAASIYPPPYSEETAHQVRVLFFTKHESLRKTAERTGLTIGTVTAIVYRKSGGWNRERVKPPREFHLSKRRA